MILTSELLKERSTLETLLKGLLGEMSTVRKSNDGCLILHSELAGCSINYDRNTSSYTMSCTFADGHTTRLKILTQCSNAMSKDTKMSEKNLNEQQSS